MEAFVLHRLSLSHQISSDPQLVPLVYILTAHWLARLRMHAPLLGLYLEVAKARDQLQPLHITLLLRVLTQADPSSDLHKIIAGLVNIAIHHKLELDTHVYRGVLEHRATDHNIAFLVEKHMRAHGFMPNLAHSRAFVRIFGEGGRKAQASRYWRRIAAGKFYGKVPSYIYKKDFQSMALEDYIKAFGHARQAEKFLKYLIRRSARPMEGDETSTNSNAPGLSGGSDIKPSVWVQVVRVAAKDPRSPTDRLLSLLEQGREHTSRSKFRTATFIVIKSLLRRQQFRAAAPLLEDVMLDNELFDTAELTVAVEALTMLDQADVAFQLLLKCQERAASPNASAGQSPARIETQTVNTFMIALLRTGRPDAVFYVWDTMPRVLRTTTWHGGDDEVTAP
ncbi:hypothetical protein BN946_scf185028.g13 [Trametes cinnabarina]|uniref:Pentacotripeptide-repeat region of PRORP domain-containing protein n=1 Tax=Pycnoporus cinnabarinus TaxID=5643 RepID=A0A060SQE8_PYCCI|nr:hypothetical protein BN946_scf185028.g13 [Trametes cinnabarina]